MRRIFTHWLVAFTCFLAAITLHAQVTCVPNGNLFVYTNYDGGVLNIDVNVNIPNIKIGVCTYEPTTINITGAFVGNVTEVRYAGYVSTNNHHCSNSPSTTTITGVPSNITSVNFLPPSTLSNPNGYSSIVCAYSCSTTSNQGGCNTADQIKDYFQQTTGGSLTSYFTQYGCWSTVPYQLSAGGNCCNTVLPCNIVANAGQNVSFCPNGSATLQGSATGGATTYSWSPTTGLSNPNAAVTTASPTTTTTYILTASDGGICSDQDTVVVTVFTPPSVSVGPFAPVCETAAPFVLTSGSPSGGIYTGTGVSNGSFFPNVAGVGSTLITYTVVDGNGCSGMSNTNIVVSGTPQVSAGNPGPFCLNDPATLLTSGSPAGGTYSGVGVINNVFDPGTAGVGTHLLAYHFVDSVGCVGDDSGSVTVNANPGAPVLTFAAPTLFTTSSGDSIQWFLNGNYLLTNGSTITPTVDGDYTAVVWSNGCASEVSQPVTVIIIGVVAPWANALQVWPNPVRNELHVALPGQEFEAVLLDALGRAVTRVQDCAGAGTLPVPALRAGVYFLKVTTAEGSAVRAIIHE